MSMTSTKNDPEIINSLYNVILKRKAAQSPDSYVASLFVKGPPKMHEKIIEEAGELVEASELGSRSGIIHEAADLLFHVLVLLGKWDIPPGEICGELARRWGVSGIAEKESRGKRGETP